VAKSRGPAVQADTATASLVAPSSQASIAAPTLAAAAKIDIPVTQLTTPAAASRRAQTSTAPERGVRIATTTKIDPRPSQSQTITTPSQTRPQPPPPTTQQEIVTQQPAVVIPRPAPTPAQEAPQPVPAAPVAADIAPAIESYARAIESKDIAAIRRVYPGLTSDQQRGFEQFFQSARTINVTFRVANVEGSSSSADARLVGTYEYVNSEGRAERQPVNFAATLRHDVNGWRLVSVR
jgi:hypothetical protein